MLTQQQLKQQAADAAIEMMRPLLSPDAVVGVGTGSTADLFIDRLGELKSLFKAAVGEL